MPQALLSLDIGTTSMKALLFDVCGKELLTIEEKYPFLCPQAGWYEQDPAQLWQAAVNVLTRAAKQLPMNYQVMAIALACQGSSLLPADQHGEPVYPLITWMDQRAQGIVDRWRGEGLEQKIFRRSGWLLDAGLPLAMMAWLRDNRPEVFSRVERWLSLNDFLAFRLTGIFCMNQSCAAAMQLTDIQTAQWDEELCAMAGARPEQFSPVYPADHIVGEILPELARLTGLPAGLPVINGGQDHSSEAVALGMIHSGDAWLGCGTAWVINAVVEQIDLDSVPQGLCLNYHNLPQRWIMSQLLGGLGASMEWLLEQLWKDEAGGYRYAELTRAVENVPPGSGGLLFLPLTGPGQTGKRYPFGGFGGLRLDHTAGYMTRAVMEGAGYELRWCLERLAAAGMQLERLWMIGGAARSAVWPRILSDQIGLPVSITQYKHGPALGVAILAGVKLGLFASVEDARAKFSFEARHFEPDSKCHDLYTSQFDRYKTFAAALADIG